MALKHRVRRAFTRTSSSASSTTTITSPTSTALSTTPTQTTIPPSPPALTLTLTRPSSRLSKITSWRSKGAKSVESEFKGKGKSKYPGGGRDAAHQAMLERFEMRFGRRGGEGAGERVGRWSMESGVSPMASRRGSVDV